MSALLFGARTGAHREDQPSQRDKWATVLAGLVPAEILAAHAVYVAATTETAGNPPVTRIDDPSSLKLAFWVLVGLSLLLCLVGRLRRGSWKWLPDLPLLFVPAAAFVGWTMLLPTSAFEAAFPDVSENARLVLGSAAAIALGTLTASGTPAKGDAQS